jgi:hypothetical protein
VASSIVDDITEVGTIATIFVLPAVLSYSLMGVIVAQVPVFTGRGSFFASGMLCPIV